MNQELRKIKINIFLLLGVFLFALFGFTKSANAATYYASPIGSGATCSQSSPCTVQTGISKLTAGAILWLLDGTYTGDSGMINTNNLHGSSGSRITIGALNEGSVLIDGQNTRVPVNVYNSSYITVQGVNAKNGFDGDSGIVVTAGNTVASPTYNELKRIVAWDSAPPYGAVFRLHQQQYALIEDSAGFGRGRYVMYPLSGGPGNIFRRNWARYNGLQDINNGPKATYQTTYYDNNPTWENNIAEWDYVSGDRVEEYGLFGWAQPNYVISAYGNIGIVRSADNYGAQELFMDGCCGAGAGTQIKNNIMYTEQSIKKPFSLVGYAPTSYSDHNTAIGGVNSYWSANFSNTNFLQQSTIGSYNLYTNTGPGATIRYRYQNGVLTSTPLWPWPMKDRIKAALNASSYASSPGGSKYVNYDIDATIQGIFGTYPSGSTPTPAPTPVPTTSTVTTNKSSYIAGETITVTANGGNSNVQEWVAVYVASNPDSSYSIGDNYLKYLNGTQTIPSAPVPYPATVTFTAPSTPGTYNIRYFAQVGYQNRLAISSNITITSPTLSADLNSDGKVNSVDAAMLMGAWGSIARPSADINKDGIVNSVDASLMMGQWTS